MVFCTYSEYSCIKCDDNLEFVLKIKTLFTLNSIPSHGERIGKGNRGIIEIDNNIRAS